MQRKIIHIDMDAFYAAIEQRDFPQYRGKPLIVGGSPSQRGVVATCNYEARKYGIHSAMAASRAYKLCPQAVFLKPRFEVYKEVSQQIRKIFFIYSNLVEPLSLDEAYLDVSDCSKCHGSATWIAKEIKQKIFEEVNLSASAGVSYNKFLAKIASDYQKPNGLKVILPAEGKDFVEKLKIRKFFGVGKATEAKLHRLNIYTGGDLKRHSLADLKVHFGKFSEYLYYAARAIDNRPVEPSRRRKSISKETTFVQDLLDLEQMKVVLKNLAIQIFSWQKKNDMFAKTMTLKVKYSNFQVITRSYSLSDETYNSLQKMLEITPQLIQKTKMGEKKVRLLGLGLSNFTNK
jgi:DNA polymerase-4